MLTAMFSFQGRLNRLQYFGRGFMTGLVLVVLAGAMIGLVAASRGQGGAPSLIVAGLGLFVVIACAIWFGLAMQARRFRDMGWEPLYVMPAWFVIACVDRLIAPTDPGQPLAALAHPTIITSVMNLVLGACLLFWPSAPPGDATPILPPIDDWRAAPGDDEAFAPAPARPTATPAPSPAGQWSPQPARTSFGRRGL